MEPYLISIATVTADFIFRAFGAGGTGSAPLAAKAKRYCSHPNIQVGMFSPECSACSSEPA